MKHDRARVGDILKLERRAVEVNIDSTYEEIGIRSFGRGVFHKEPASGAQLAAKRVFKIEPGDLLLSNVFAWEGAIAVASESERGKIGSHRFMTYVPLDRRIDTTWVSWYFRSEAGLELIRQASPGSAGRNRTLAIDRFEAIEIPLPPIEEQRRTAAELNGVAITTERISKMSAHASTLASALAVSLCTRPDLDDVSKSSAGWRLVKLGEVLVTASERARVEVTNSYPNAGIYSFGRGMFEKPDIDGSLTSAGVLNRVRHGQFIYSRLFAFEGAYAYVPQEFDGFYVSNEFPSFDVDPRRIDARWLASYIRSPERWAQLAGLSKGIGVRRQRVPAQAVLNYKVWLPPISVQRNTLRAIERLQKTTVGRQRAEQRMTSLVAAAMNAAFAESN
jgi:type I restriction enzyme, S subunit